ncbi:MAG: DUF5627 domain-containing protein [Tannerella sp.]|jgi:hypothetical protein|nr:DUF5627 domain-containing protein [Tannerella sp.]
MKKILLFIAIVAGICSCKNFETDFPNYDYTTVFFPYQFPVRTIIKGNYIYDNTNDNNNKFLISTTMGGVNDNISNRIVYFTLDEELCREAYFSNSEDDPILPLPSEYYTLSNNEKFIIPPGSLSGSIEVQLKDAFFNDTAAIKKRYVVPIRITGISNIDSLLQGSSTTNNADPRVASNWSVIPRHFTMFGVKYINPFHGNFLYYGKASSKENGVAVGDSIYQAQYVERNETLFLETAGRTEIKISNIIYRSANISGAYSLKLKFASEDINNGDIICTVEAGDESDEYTVSGSGRFVNRGESFGGEKKDAIYLEYTVTKGKQSYSTNETFVFRDKAINLETYAPVIIPES